VPTELRTEKMRSMLARGRRKTRQHLPPSEGMMRGLINETSKNGWHYQVEWIRDLSAPEPYVIVYAWPPGERFGGHLAKYFLSS